MIKHSLTTILALCLAQTALAATPEQIARAALKAQLEAEERARLAARTPKGTGAAGGGGGGDGGAKNKKAKTAS